MSSPVSRTDNPRSTAFRPITPELVPLTIADLLLARGLDHPQRVAVDGPAAAAPAELAEQIALALRTTGRAATVIAAASFWRDASLRLEYGRTDVDSYARDWLDTGALTREVLDPLGPGGSAEFLPALRDPVSNRSRRDPYRTAAPDEVVLVAGELLLGAGLTFDTTIHLSLSSAARARRTAPDDAWTLPAHDRYDVEVDPAETADIVIGWNDRAHPALRVR